MQSDPIGLDGGENGFVYVGGNPLVRVDESGLILEVNFVFQKNINDIIATPTGNMLFFILENSSTIYVVDIPDFSYDTAYQADYPTKYIIIDPNFHPYIYTTCGRIRASTTRILAHELGHLTGTLDDGPGKMNNVNKWENPIMKHINGCLRTKYSNK